MKCNNQEVSGLVLCFLLWSQDCVLRRSPPCSAAAVVCWNERQEISVFVLLSVTLPCAAPRSEGHTVLQNTSSANTS